MPTPTYHLFVDDSGSRFIDRPSTPRNDGMDYFAMGGILIKAEEARQTTVDLDKICEKYSINYPLHSTKIRSKKKEWSWLGDQKQKNKADSFMEDLSNFLCNIPGHATACVVHRPGYLERYSHYPVLERWKLCKSVYSILIERAAKIALRDGRKLAVYIEQTGKREDADICRYHTEMIEKGINFNPVTSSKYNPLNSQDFSLSLLKNPNFFNKSLRMGQVADLLLYPLVKGRYDKSYLPYINLHNSCKIIDNTLKETEEHLGVQYYCFDGV